MVDEPIAGALGRSIEGERNLVNATEVLPAQSTPLVGNSHAHPTSQNSSPSSWLGTDRDPRHERSSDTPTLGMEFWPNTSLSGIEPKRAQKADACDFGGSILRIPFVQFMCRKMVGCTLRRVPPHLDDCQCGAGIYGAHG